MAKSLREERTSDNKCALCGKTRDMRSFKNKNICMPCIHHVRGEV